MRRRGQRRASEERGEASDESTIRVSAREEAAANGSRRGGSQPADLATRMGEEGVMGLEARVHGAERSQSMLWWLWEQIEGVHGFDEEAEREN